MVYLRLEISLGVFGENSIFQEEERDRSTKAGNDELKSVRICDH